MRVALVVASFPQRSETFVVSHFLGLLARGIDAHVVCDHVNRALWPSVRQLDRPDVRARVHESGTRSPGALVARGVDAVRTLSSTAGRQHAAASVGRGFVRSHIRGAPITRRRPDIVHFEFGALARGRQRRLHQSGIATVVSFRGFDISHAGLEDPTYYEEVWSCSDAIHVLGAHMHDQLRTRGFAGQCPVVTVPPAVDVPPRCADSPGAPGGTLRVVSIGRLSWVKGYEWALEALRQVLDAGVDAHLTVIGEGPMRSIIELQVRELSLDGHVSLIGEQLHDATRAALAGADLFLQCSVSEGFGNAPLEAQAAGVACVVTDAGGLPENVVHGVTGLVVARRDSAAICRAVLELQRDPGRRNAMGEAGRMRAAEFSEERQMQGFAHLYETALTTHRAHR